MGWMKDDLNVELTRCAPSKDSWLIANRARQVHEAFKIAVQHLFRDNWAYILSHVNSVYITKDKTTKRPSLIIYSDDGLVRSELHTQQHFILLALNEHCGESVELFKALPSRFNMREHHPYADEIASTHGDNSASPKRARPLTETEKQEILATASSIEHEEIKSALIKAMAALRAWNR